MSQRLTYWSAIVLVLAAARGATAAPIPVEPGFWSEPAFRARVLEHVGINTRVEPEATPGEQVALDRARPYLEDSNTVAKARSYLERIANGATKVQIPRPPQPGAPAGIKPGSDSVSASGPVVAFTVAGIAYQQNDWPGAAYWCQRALDGFPAFLRAHRMLGIVCVRTNGFEQAIAPLTRVVELGGADGLTYGLLAHACANTDRITQAETAFRTAMLLQPTVLDWQLGLVRCLFRLQKYEEASILCGELLRRDPDRVDYRLLQANAWIGLNQPLRAAETYELLDLAGQASSGLLNTLGDIYVNEELPDLAADAYLRALAADTAGEPGRFVRHAEVLAMRGAPGDATRVIAALRQHFGSALAGDELKRTLKLEARLLASRGTGGDAQAALLDEIVRLDPLDGEALILLAQHHAATGNVARAEFLFEQASAVEKYEADARLKYGQFLVRNARYPEALPLLKRAHELRPREEVARYIEQVERAARLRD